MEKLSKREAEGFTQYIPWDPNSEGIRLGLIRDK